MPARGITDYAGIALAAGYRAAYRFDDKAHLAQQIGSFLTEAGPVFVNLKIDPGPVKQRDYKPLRAQALRDAFKAALARA